jgi:hypothetical protein
MSIVFPGVPRLLLIASVLFAAFPAAAQQPTPASAPAAPATAATPATPGAPPAGQPAAQANGPGPENGIRRSMTALRMADSDAVTLDGRLDEPFWARAVPAADFIQQDPQNGRPATEPTEVRVAYNKDVLYIGVTAFDSEPEKWLGYQRRRDEGLGGDDRFMWVIDTFLDGQTGYFFEMNPSGLMADALMGTNGQNREWDGIWNARHYRSNIGWNLEIAIPFRTLNFNPNNDTWGINFQRTVRRKNEESLWMGWQRNQNLRRMSNAGLVTGIRDVTQGRGLDIKPYGLFMSESFPGHGSPAIVGNTSAGIDLFYNATPQLRTNFTLNTDFAQTEVDQRQVNLTRYSLFFPEQRDFFLDGAIFFDFASPTNARGGFNNQSTFDTERVIPFFSRRIGLSTESQPQKIDFGTKVTGQVGGQDVGVLHVRTGDEDDTNTIGEEFTVFRVKRRMLSQSYIGAMYTRRDPRLAGADTAQTAGIDTKLATNSFLGSENLEFSGWFLNTMRKDVSGGTSAFGMNIDYPNDLWNGRVEAVEIQENFDPQVGFVTRQAYRRFSQVLDFQPRPQNHRHIRQMTFGGAFTLQTDLENQLLMRGIEFTPFQMNFHSQDNFGLLVANRKERLDEPFDLTDEIILPMGSEYSFNRYRLYGQTAGRRMLSFNVRYELGDFYSGTRTEQQATMNVRLRPGLFMQMTGQWNTIDLPEGDFTTKLFRFTGETQFSPFMALVNNIQYDTQSAVLGWQSRFRWILTPGNDLYLVYTHNWLDDPVRERFESLDRRMASKILYTYRF